LALLALGCAFRSDNSDSSQHAYFTKHDPAHREPEIVKDLETQKAWRTTLASLSVFYLALDGLVRWGVI